MAEMENNSGDKKPVPDPTALTSEAVRQAVEQSRRDIHGLRQIIEARLDGIESLAQERYESVARRLEAAENIRKEQKADTERNVAAALAAIQKQIDLLTTNSTDNFVALRRDIDSLRGSLGSGPPM